MLKFSSSSLGFLQYRRGAASTITRFGASNFLLSCMFALGLPSLPLGQMLAAETNATSSTAPAAVPSTAAPVDNSPPTMEKGAQLYTEGKSEEALATVNAILSKDPNNAGAYVLRGAIYSQESAWSQAEDDYNKALQMNPKNDGVRFDLADLKFKQKQFDAAKAAFISLQNYQDADVRDLIAYKIFLCDLFGGHLNDASKELDVFNQVGSNPSYYFGNAAWNLVNKKTEDARSWLDSAHRIYSPRKQLLYATVLKDMGYLPLPPPPDAK